MDEKMKYRCAAKQDEEQLTKLATLSPSDLRAEIAVARLMLQRAVDQNSPAAVSLLTVLAKLSKSDLENRVRSRELLPKEEVQRICQQIVDIVCEEIQGIDGYETIIDRVAERLAETEQQNDE